MRSLAKPVNDIVHPDNFNYELSIHIKVTSNEANRPHGKIYSGK